MRIDQQFLAALAAVFPDRPPVEDLWKGKIPLIAEIGIAAIAIEVNIDWRNPVFEPR